MDLTISVSCLLVKLNMSETDLFWNWQERLGGPNFWISKSNCKNADTDLCCWDWQKILGRHNFELADYFMTDYWEWMAWCARPQHTSTIPSQHEVCLHVHVSPELVGYPQHWNWSSWSGFLSSVLNQTTAEVFFHQSTCQVWEYQILLFEIHTCFYLSKLSDLL